MCLSNHNHPHISLQCEDALGGSNTNVLLDLYPRSSWTRYPWGGDYVQGETLCLWESHQKACQQKYLLFWLCRMAPGGHWEPLEALEPDRACSEPTFRSSTGKGEGDRLGEEWVLTGHLPSSISPALSYLCPHSNSVSRTGLLLPPFFNH